MPVVIVSEFVVCVVTLRCMHSPMGMLISPSLNETKRFVTVLGVASKFFPVIPRHHYQYLIHNNTKFFLWKIFMSD